MVALKNSEGEDEDAIVLLGDEVSLLQHQIIRSYLTMI